MKEEFLKHLQRILREDQRALEENMSSHVTFRTGGPAEYYVRPNRQQIQPVLELCRRFDVPWMVIGNGSNLLVGDRGIRGLVMEIGRMMDRISIDGELVTAEAGASVLCGPVCRKREPYRHGICFRDSGNRRRGGGYERRRIRRRDKTDP